MGRKSTRSIKKGRRGGMRKSGRRKEGPGGRDPDQQPQLLFGWSPERKLVRQPDGMSVKLGAQKQLSFLLHSSHW